MIEALAWLETVFGEYPYPQLTNVHRLEGGGTEFPMLVMNGSASLGLILHEAAHQYAHAILANNEWDEAWLDEGLASFLGGWYRESRGEEDVWSGSVELVSNAVAAGLAQPIATRSELLPDFATYGTLAYTKPALVYRMLRELLGEDVFRRGLRRYYERKKLQHVTERDFRAAMEEVSGQPLAWFFDQWIRSTAVVDYAITDVVQAQNRDGTWRTTVTVMRSGEAWMPVVLQIGEETVTLTTREPRQEVEVVTTTRPQRIVVDPDRVMIDPNWSNNHASPR